MSLDSPGSIRRSSDPPVTPGNARTTASADILGSVSKDLRVALPDGGNGDATRISDVGMVSGDPCAASMPVERSELAPVAEEVAEKPKHARPMAGTKLSIDELSKINWSSEMAIRQSGDSRLALCTGMGRNNVPKRYLEITDLQRRATVINQEWRQKSSMEQQAILRRFEEEENKRRDTEATKDGRKKRQEERERRKQQETDALEERSAQDQAEAEKIQAKKKEQEEKEERTKARKAAGERRNNEKVVRKMKKQAKQRKRSRSPPPPPLARRRRSSSFGGDNTGTGTSTGTSTGNGGGGSRTVSPLPRSGEGDLDDERSFEEMDIDDDDDSEEEEEDGEPNAEHYDALNYCFPEDENQARRERAIANSAANKLLEGMEEKKRKTGDNVTTPTHLTDALSRTKLQKAVEAYYQMTGKGKDLIDTSPQRIGQCACHSLYFLG